MAATKKAKVKKTRTHLFTMRMTKEDMAHLKSLTAKRSASAAAIIRGLIQREDEPLSYIPAAGMMRAYLQSKGTALENERHAALMKEIERLSSKTHMLVTDILESVKWYSDPLKWHWEDLRGWSDPRLEEPEAEALVRSKKP